MQINSNELQIVIPAASSSTRLGSPKQLVNTQAGLLWQRTIDVCLAISRSITIVTGSWRPSSVLPNGVIECHFPRWSEGMGSSIAYGIQNSPTPTKGYLIVLIDQWGLTKETLHEFVSAWNGENIQLANDGNYKGPPVLFPAHYQHHLSALRGDEGAKSLIKQSTSTEQILGNAALDLDTPADLKFFQQIDNAKNKKEQEHDFT